MFIKNLHNKLLVGVVVLEVNNVLCARPILDDVPTLFPFWLLAFALDVRDELFDG